MLQIMAFADEGAQVQAWRAQETLRLCLAADRGCTIVPELPHCQEIRLKLQYLMLEPSGDGVNADLGLVLTLARESSDCFANDLSVGLGRPTLELRAVVQALLPYGRCSCHPSSLTVGGMARSAKTSHASSSPWKATIHSTIVE